METNTYKNIARKYFQLFSNKDIDGLEEMFDSDCSLRDWEINVTGKENVLKANQGIFDDVQTIHVEALHLYAEGMIVVGELLITVNNEEKILVTDVIEFTPEGKIKSIRAYKG